MADRLDDLIGGVDVQHVHVGQRQVRHGIGPRGVDGRGLIPVRLLGALHIVLWGQADAGALGADGLGDGARHLDCEAGPVLGRAAVAVGAVVRRRREELLQQVAVRAVDLHRVEAGLNRTAGRVGELAHDVADLLLAQLMRHGGVDLAFGDAHGLRCRHRAGAHDAPGARDLGVGDAPAVHDLQGDRPALGVHGIGDAAPPGDVLGRLDARLPVPGAPFADRPRALGDDHAGARALAVVLDHEVVGGAVLLGPQSGQRRHDDAVRRLNRTEADRSEQGVGRVLGGLGAHGGSPFSGGLRASEAVSGGVVYSG